MDYNDNDYEGQNLHLTGEESSKLSSVLRPFALPKFDFDDGLHGHLRFDSLVENEVFLGIPSQEDNHWIEEFSRGGNEIEFSSSATESCALPRHINVWSEATSSESVEMLLKSVGQEEMNPGENMVEESGPIEQLDSSMRQGESDLRQDEGIDGADQGNLSSRPAEVEGNISRSNHSAGIEDVKTDYPLQAQETSFPSSGARIDCKDSVISTTKNSNIDMKISSDNQGETCDVMNESLSNQVQEILPIPASKVQNTGSLSQECFVNVRESIDQDKRSDICLVISSCTGKGVSDSVEELKTHYNKNDEKLSGIVVEADNRKRHSGESPSKMDSLNEECAIDSRISEFGEASGTAVMVESETTDDQCNEVAFLVKPAGAGQHAPVVSSSGSEIKQQSDDCSILPEKSSSHEYEGIEGPEMKGSDGVTLKSYGYTELKQFPIGQPSDQHKILVGKEDMLPGSNSSIEASHASLKSSIVLHDVLCNPSEKDGESNINHADGPGNLTGPTFASGCPGEASAVEGTRDANNTASQKENLHDGDHVSPSLITKSTQTCAENITPIQVDTHEPDLDFSAHKKGDKESPLNSSDVVGGDNEKKVESTFLVERVKFETITGSQLDSAASDYPVSNTEDEGTKVTSSGVEDDEFVENHEYNPPSFNTVYRNDDQETESEVPKQPSAPVSNDSSELSELPPAMDTEKGTTLDSSAGETKINDQPVSLVWTAGMSLSDDTCKELNQNTECSAKDLTVQDDRAEAASAEIPIDVENGKASSTPPVISCTVEVDKSSQSAASDVISCTNLPQSEIKKPSSLRSDSVENIDKAPATSEMSRVTVPSKEEGIFTFDIRPLGVQSTGELSNLQSFPKIQPCKLSSTGEGSSSTSCSNHTNPIVVTEISQVSSLTPDVNAPSGVMEEPSKRKTRRGSNKSGKGSAKKGNQVKETTLLRQAEKRNKTSQVLSPLGPGQLVTFESGVKQRGAVTIPTSSLPDLNTSAPSSAYFQQPFSDLQQVQLRAQIFVYGSLIQGAAPDEACMISAFDGGRSIWEPSWRTCVERLHGQKSQGTNAEKPSSSHPDAGAKAPDQINRQSLPQSEVLSSMAVRANNKFIPSHVVNPMIPLSSPLWSISTPSGEALPPSSTARSAIFDYQAVSPLNSYQTPPMRNYIAHTTWPSQATFPVPWLASSQSSPFDISTNYPAFPITEPIKLTPVKDSSLPLTSSTKHAASASATHIGTTAMFAGPSSVDLKKVKVSTGQTADTKTRKRKKSSGAEDIVLSSLTSPLAATAAPPIVATQLLKAAPAVEDLSRMPLIARNQADLMPTPVVSDHYSTSVTVTTPSSFLPKASANQFFSVAPHSVSTDHLSRSDLNTDKRPLNIEGFSKVEEAKLQAQEAAAHAAAAISHCEGVWSRLDQQKNSGLTSDAESKLASAAAAIAAAASVAKAAAAAAKIASSAAVQAKQMADEAVTKSGTMSSSEYGGIRVSSSLSNLGNASPASILKAADQKSAPSLAISAAREAARKRIEAASAATKHAENLDAIVKAAELAAEAVTHAGKIVAMGDPFSLNELVEAGPNNYWKVSPVATMPGSKPNDINRNRSINSNAGEISFYMDEHEGPDKNMPARTHVVSVQRETPRKMLNDHGSAEENFLGSVKHGEKNFRPEKDEKVADSSKSFVVVSDPDVDSRSNSFALSSIKEGSNVEVLKDRGDLKKAWFSASVLSLKDDKAIVCYKELESEEGSEKLQEWISVVTKDGEAPNVRIPHPMSAVQFDGTRKRSRAAVKDYTWSVGDKVDAWVQDCWREGIIAEKNKKDATALSVHFPAQGETLMVKVWHLRPTLIWRDGQWIEWCRPVEDGTSQGDSPMEKRQKLVTTSSEAKGKGKMARSIDILETGRQEEPRLPLSANEKVFSIGNTREENKANTIRTVRSGLEKERSGVVFGVPKPGKKRKFMEVSKHYVSDRAAKTNVPNDSVKLAKYLTPQGSRSRGLKNNSKHDLKEKQVADLKPKIHKSGKPPVPGRTLARKDDSNSSRPNASDGAASDHIVKGSVSYEENESGDQNLAEFGSSNIEETTGGTMVFTSQALPLEKRKKAATRNIRSERLNQGKLALASGKSARNEGSEKLISEVGEPRRSNRRIQPTSRLLEGLQSSLIISKIPSSSHDKSHRSQNKGTTRGK